MTTPRIAIAVDQATNDFFFDASGNLAMARDAEAVGQHIRQRLKHHAGEWYLDTEAGVPWLDEVLGRQFNPALAEALIKAEVVATDGVKEISSFSVTFDRTKRQLAATRMVVLTDYDEGITL